MYNYIIKCSNNLYSFKDLESAKKKLAEICEHENSTSQYEPSGYWTTVDGMEIYCDYEIGVIAEILDLSKLEVNDKID